MISTKCWQRKKLWSYLVEGSRVILQETERGTSVTHHIKAILSLFLRNQRMSCHVHSVNIDLTLKERCKHFNVVFPITPLKFLEDRQVGNFYFILCQIRKMESWLVLNWSVYTITWKLAISSQCICSWIFRKSV